MENGINMKIKQFDYSTINKSLKTDSIDTPECFGEFKKKDKLCSQYCCVAIKCCVMHNRNPKIDIMEQLLTNNHFAIKIQ